MALFDPELSRKPQIVAVNKLDMPEVQQRWPELEGELKKRLKRTSGSDLMAVSALAGTNIRQLLYKAAQLLQEFPPELESGEIPVYRVESDPGQFTIIRISDGYRVSGEAIERAAKMTYWENIQSIRRFQRILKALGIDEALRKAGVENGDTVYIGDFELEWQD
jgi:GTP-binding protein